MLREERCRSTSGHHIFRFQPAYAAEARERYGVESATG